MYSSPVPVKLNELQGSGYFHSSWAAASIRTGTVAERGPLLESLLGLSEAPFKPSIPNLVYQYSLFLNFDAQVLNEVNQEVD